MHMKERMIRKINLKILEQSRKAAKRMENRGLWANFNEINMWYNTWNGVRIE